MRTLEKNLKENRKDYIEGIENANKITLSLLLLQKSRNVKEEICRFTSTVVRGVVK